MPVDLGTLKRLDRETESDRKRRKDDDDRKVIDDVFDTKTLTTLHKMLSNGILTSLDYPIATGKEGKVFKATGPGGGPLAVKIYCISNATFRSIADYIAGDPRFSGLERNKGKLIFTWAKKEYKNLSRLHDNSLPVPKPVAIKANVIAMEYIGDESRPAETLKRAGTDRPEWLFGEIAGYMRIQHQKARLVHGDLSEYNILMYEGKPRVIDVGQAVTVDHPMAREWLLRDVSNVCRYFSSLGVDADPKALYERIVGEEGKDGPL